MQTVYLAANEMLYDQRMQVCFIPCLAFDIPGESIPSGMFTDMESCLKAPDIASRPQVLLAVQHEHLVNMEKLTFEVVSPFTWCRCRFLLVDMHGNMLATSDMAVRLEGSHA